MYTEEQKKEIINKIFEEMTAGKSLRQICSADNMPDKATILRWLLDSEEFATIIARARTNQIEHYMDLIFEKAETCDLTTESIQKAKLEIDNIKWVASKLLPKKYGDKMALQHSGSMTTKVIYDDIK